MTPKDDAVDVGVGVPRHEHVSSDAERESLLAVLGAQRNHVLTAVAGLSDEALRRPVLPSGWTCLGLIQHLTLDVERFWFRAVAAGESVSLCAGDEAWQIAPTASGVEVIDAYRTEIRLADAAISGTPLDAPPAWWPTDLFGTLPVRNLRQNILAVVVETACHAGHLDAARELIDGHQHLVLT